MKALFISSLLFLLVACSTQKEITVNTESVNPTLSSATETVQDTLYANNNIMRVIGTVRTTENGCLTYIDAKTISGNVTMYPVNLDDRFKKEGIFIRFTYTPSRAMQPKDCDCNQVVSVHDVTRLR
jgi:hypothetical protein